MRLEHYPIDELRERIVTILSRYLDLRDYRTFFFGSRVAGKGDERSDIDIGIEGIRPIPFHIMHRIRDDIEELPTMYTVEIVDFRRVSPDFRDVALHNVEPLTTPA